MATEILWMNKEDTQGHFAIRNNTGRIVLSRSDLGEILSALHNEREAFYQARAEEWRKKFRA